MSMTILDKNYGLEYIKCDKRRYVVHNNKIYFISRHWSQPWLSWSWRRRRNLSCALSKGCVITMNSFRLACLHFCRSVASWQSILSQVCCDFCRKKYCQNYVKNSLKISVSYPKHYIIVTKEEIRSKLLQYSFNHQSHIFLHTFDDFVL